MMLRDILKKAKEMPVSALISDGNYTHVHFADGQNCVSGYTKKVILAKLGRVDLKAVRRGVDVSKTAVQVNGGKVKFRGMQFDISRRKLQNWLACVLCFVGFISFAQNVAPTAVNDTLKVCNDIPTIFTVTSNDFDENGDRLKIKAFTKPATGDLVSQSNTGKFRYDWQGVESGQVSFTYTLQDLRFGGVGSLTSNSATVVMYSAAPYYYSGTYTTTASRETCRSENSGTTTINTTAREVNEAYQYILLDANNGAVTIQPDSTGTVEFKIKQ